MALGNDDYVNSSFKHFIHFASHFQLMEIQDYNPLKDLIKAIMDPAIEVGSDASDDEEEEEEVKEKPKPKKEIDPELLVDSDVSDFDDIDVNNLSDLEDDDDDDILED